MIVIIDYDIGNTGSILNIIRRVGGDAIASRDEQDISTAAALILPGVYNSIRRCGVINRL